MLVRSDEWTLKFWQMKLTARVQNYIVNNDALQLGDVAVLCDSLSSVSVSSYNFFKCLTAAFFKCSALILVPISFNTLINEKNSAFE